MLRVKNVPDAVVTAMFGLVISSQVPRTYKLVRQLIPDRERPLCARSSRSMGASLIFTGRTRFSQ
jgi:hypothetical protein